jgi:dienelactone hydrolase
MQKLASCLLWLTALAGSAAAEIESIDELWAGFDPRALPLEVEVVKAWDEGDVHLETIYFTGEVFEGEKTRIFGYVGRPRNVTGKVPGILHIHGGGQTANLDWPRFWAKRGYVCLSFDFCGNTNLPTLGPAYRREHYTRWGKVPADMMKIGGGTQMTPTPRSNPWFHWALAARRGLTLLESQPDVDADKLGIFGISVGGTLTWTVAGVDARVKTAAPIYGCGWEFYTYPPQFDADYGSDLKLWRKLIAPEAHAARITCPLLLLSATNDGHGRMDLAYRTLDLLASPIRSQVFTANYDHHVEPPEARSLPLWMDTHLKGAHPAWPATPHIEFAGGEVPQVRVVPDNASDVERVDIYYCLDRGWPTGRFWRMIADVRREGDVFVGDSPFFSREDMLCAFANVTHKTGVRISSRLAKQPAISLSGARPTLDWQSTIDEMETDTAWNWVPAPTDPTRESGTFFGEWRGADGERGFTLDPQMFPREGPMGFYFGSRKIGDPQFRSAGHTALLLDCLADNVPEKLTVRLRHHPPTNTGQEYEATFATALAQIEPHGAWRTLRMEAAQFHNAQGEPLPDWNHVEFFVLDGVSPAHKPPVFKRLRWAPMP